MERTEGKRVAAPPKKVKKGGKAPLIIGIAVLVVLAAAYAGLCAMAGSGTFLPNTTIADVDVGGQTVQQAVERLEAQLPQTLAETSVEFACEGKTYTVSGADAEADVDGAVEQAMADQSGSFFTRGWQYLTALTGFNQYPVSVTLKDTPEAVEQAVEECADPEAQTTWEVEGDQLVLHKGVTGRTIDTAALLTELEERLGHLLSNDEPAAYAAIQTQVTTAPPADPDFDRIHQEVYVEPADAYLDKETKEIVPSVTGVDFDPAAAKSALDSAEEGTQVTVPLTLTEPNITTQTFEANLFKDVLGSGTTSCAGPSERWYNIDLAASRVNGTILLPGETFSYNALAGPYTLSSGYKKAGTYQNGQSIDATAGGICQLSSTIYWVTLKANLETVERTQHAFNSGYMPVVGTDATVWSDVTDFKFKNSTDYPIKLEAYQDKNHKLHVTIYGTDTTGIHGEPYSVTISTVAYKNLYKPKDSIPVGTEPQRDPNYSRYNGITVDVYQKLVDADGNVVDTIFLYRNTYKASNAVYYYNPADAARWGIDPSTELKTLTPVTPTPSATPTPATTPTPEASSSATQPPIVSTQPTPNNTPAATPSATPSAEPAATPTPAPAASPTAGPGMEPVEDVPSATPAAESTAAP